MAVSLTEYLASKCQLLKYEYHMAVCYFCTQYMLAHSLNVTGFLALDLGIYKMGGYCLAVKFFR